ncbi:MAG: hypothetical protein ACSHYA_04830 [Opitutaceae bacterium]
MNNSTNSNGSIVKTALCICAILIVLGATAFWISTGAHTGFSKNRVEIPMIDPITQIEYVDYEERFIMGVEYLALAYGIGIVGFGLSFAFGRKKI